MLALTRSLDDAPPRTGVHIASLLLLVVLAVLLGCGTLVQLFLVIPHPNLFIRLAELTFVGAFLFEVAQRYEAPDLPRAAGWLLLGWLVASALSVAFASHFGPALIRQAEWITHFLFGLALWGVVQRHPPALNVILVTIPLGFLLTGLHTLATWLTLDDPYTYNWFTSVPLIGHVRHFGYYALAGLIFSSAPLLSIHAQPTWTARTLAVLGMTFCWSFLFWSGGRAAIGAGLLGIAAIVWLAGRGQRVVSLALAAAALGLGLWLSTFFAVADPRLGFFESLARTAADTSANGVNGFTTGRLGIWSEALQAFAISPWLGLGPDGYKFLPIETHGGIQPHSLFVQFLVDWGLLGAVPFVLLLGLAFWKGSVRLVQETDPLRKTARVTAMAFLLSATVHSFVDGLYYYAQPLLFLVTAFAVALLPASTDQPASAPSFRWLTARPTLWAVFVLLAAIFFLNSDFVYRWFL